MSKSKLKSKLHCDWRSVNQSVSLGVEPHLGFMTRYLLLFDIYGLVLWGAHSDERTGLSFVYAGSPRQRSLSRAESLGSRNHILLSQFWDFPFRHLLRLAGSRWRYSTPLNPGRKTMFESESESHCDWGSVSLSVLVSSPVRGSWPDICYCLTISVLSLGGRPLWREGGSVFCQSLTAVISQLSVCTVIYI
jgi:hypothetical protein